VCLAAITAGKHAATEVPAALNLDDCWRLVETSEKTRKHCVMMENCNYDRFEMMVLNMVEQMDALRALHAQADAGRTMVNQRIAALADAVEGLTSRLEDDVGQLAALDRIAEGQDRIAELLARRIEEGGGGDGGIDAESRMRLRSIDVQLLRLLEEVAAGRQESVADLRADIAQLTKAVRGLGTTGQARRGP
jgi:hypothetical protein